MKAFSFIQASSLGHAAAESAAMGTSFIAGGTNIVDLMKLNVESPSRLVDVTKLGMNQIESDSHGNLRIGAMVRNSELAEHRLVKERFAVLSEAILSGASPQLRNMATTGGNLLQKTRCPYYRDVAFACNKRSPGSGCPAIEGHNRNQAILGGSEHCIAVNPSDMNVALMALGAMIHLHDGKNERAVPIQDFYLLPGGTPHQEFAMMRGEIITAVTVNAQPKGAKSLYVKLRDRASYEFALASCAAIMKISSGVVESVQIAFGGVGTVPWRANRAEQSLKGKAPTTQNFADAADAELIGAAVQSENAFKVELIKRCTVYTLSQLANGGAL